MKASNSVRAAAAVQFLGSLAGLIAPGLVWASEIQLRRLNPRNYQPQPTRFYVVLVAVPICLCLLGVVTSIGVFHRREWARRVTLSWATVSTLVCALWLMLHHPRSMGDAILVIGDLSNAFAAILLVILAPISLWWWILFTRKSVRTQFRERWMSDRLSGTIVGP
jgi:hypothetical protein